MHIKAHKGTAFFAYMQIFTQKNAIFPKICVFRKKPLLLPRISILLQ